MSGLLSTGPQVPAGPDTRTPEQKAADAKTASAATAKRRTRGGRDNNRNVGGRDRMGDSDTSRGSDSGSEN